MLTIKDIYEKYKQDVFRYLISLTHNPTLSEDLVSETFLSAIKSLPRFKGDSDIKTWLFSIARYKWYEYLRKNKEEIAFDDLASKYITEKTNLESKVIISETAAKILALLEKESARTKDIVLMRIEGYSFYEISIKHEVSESSARVIDFRAKKKIKEILEKEGLKMSEISCDICLDLIPLVNDNIASKASSLAVKDHMKECESCREFYEIEDFAEIAMDDSRVILKIKQKLYSLAIITIIFGAILGISLTEGIGMFYNILIMPAIGVVGYFALSKKSYYVPITLFGFIYIWLVMKYMIEGMLSYAPFSAVLVTPIYWALIYSGLCSLGIVIGFLLHIAFRKEDNDEKNN